MGQREEYEEREMGGGGGRHWDRGKSMKRERDGVGGGRH